MNGMCRLLGPMLATWHAQLQQVHRTSNGSQWGCAPLRLAFSLSRNSEADGLFLVPLRAAPMLGQAFPGWGLLPQISACPE